MHKYFAQSLPTGAVLGFALSVTLFGLILGPAISLVRPALSGSYNQWSYPTYQATFEQWEAVPISEHLFLAFNNEERAQKKLVWGSGSPLQMVGMYLFTLPVRIAGAPLKVFEFTTVIPGFLGVLYLMALHLLPRRPENENPALHTLYTVQLALGCAVLCTLPSYWVAALRFELMASLQILPALVFCHLAVLDSQGREDNISGLIAMSILVLLIPVYTPIVLLTAFVLWGTKAGEDTVTGLGVRRLWLKRIFWLGLAGAFSLMWPHVMSAIGGYHNAGSSILYRSGLDGSTQHFQSIWQSIAFPRPSTGRAWSFFPLVLLAPLLTMTVAYWDRKRAVQMARQLFLSVLPYFYFAILFPQALSIHPYSYDMTILFPIAFCLVYWAATRWREAYLERQFFLGGLLVWAALLMTNLLELSRFKA